MKAADARKISEKQAAVIAKQEAEAAAKRKVQREAAHKKKHADYYTELLSSIEYSIKSAVEYGETSTTYGLASESNHWGGDHEKICLYWEASFFKNFEFSDEVKRVMAKLRKDGYKVEYVEHIQHHDDSAAYLNSGGECGSETPYHTNDSLLRVSW